MSQIAATAIIFPNVTLGKGCVVEDYCIIGAPVNGTHPETFIGDHAVIRSHSVIYAGNRIGHYFHMGNKANLREFNEIGNHVSIGALSIVEHHTVIGDFARLHSNVFLPEYSTLEEGVWLGPNVTVTNAKFPQTPGVKEHLIGPTFEQGAVVGAGSVILPGIRVGSGSLIGAGSVVTRSTEPNMVYYGNPATRQGPTQDDPYQAKAPGPKQA